MKFFLLTCLILVCACRKEEAANLNEAEREYLRNQATIRCRAENKERYDTLRDGQSTFYHSTNERGRLYTYELKNDSTVKMTVKLKVWSRDRLGESVIFYVEDENKKYFWKVSRAEGEELIDDLFEAHCNTALKNFKVGVGESLGITYTQEATDGTGKKVYTDTYSIPAGTAVAFARFYADRKVESKDANDTVTSTVNLSNNITSKVEAWAVETDLYTEVSGAQRFCEITGDLRGQTPTQEVYGLGYLFNPDSCPTSLPAGWDMVWQDDN